MHIALSKGSRRSAFTLAEVLITLGIIGVVAAMTMSAIVTNYQKKQTVERLKKAYSELNQILVRAEQDYGPVKDWGYNNEKNLSQWVNTYIVPYVKTLGVAQCSTGNHLLKCEGINNFMALKKATYQSQVSTRISGGYIVVKSGDIPALRFFRNDGIYINDIFVYVYLNNKSIPVLGRDVFCFVLRMTDDLPRFKPYYARYLENRITREALLGTGGGGCNPAASWGDYRKPGDSCAALIMYDGWKIAPDYPW